MLIKTTFLASHFDAFANAPAPASTASDYAWPPEEWCEMHGVDVHSEVSYYLPLADALAGGCGEAVNPDAYHCELVRDVLDRLAEIDEGGLL